jgi:hypothetical protein
LLWWLVTDTSDPLFAVVAGYGPNFLKAGLKQRKALLQTISDVQLKALGEVVHNLLFLVMIGLIRRTRYLIPFT